jgi:hypothetical protein
MRLANRRARALVLADRVAAVAALAVPLLILVPHLAVAGDQPAAKPASAHPGAGTVAQTGAQPGTSGVPSPTADGQVFYVDSVHGSDSNTGLSPAQAWQSLSRIPAAKLQPGDVVAFARGDTFTGSATIDTGGTASAPVTFAAYGTGAAPILTNPGQWNMLVLNAPYIDVVNLHFNNGVVFNDDDGTGIAGPKYELSGAVDITDAGTYAQVENDVFTDVGVGVKTYATNTLIQHNTFANLQIAFVGEDSGSETSYGAIGVSLDNSDEHVAYNSFVNCRSTDSPYRADGGAIEIEGFNYDKDNILIDHNDSVGSQGFLEVTETESSNVTLSYNVSDDYQQFVAWDTTTTPDHYLVVNNTVVRRHDSFSSPLFDIYYYRQVGPSPQASWLSAENNVFYTPYGTVFGPFNWPHDHNLFWGDGNDPVGYQLGIGDIIADPQFVDFDGGDLRLQPTSPAIGNGVATTTTTDLAGNPTDVNGVDMGAYEYQGQLPDTSAGLVDGGFEHQASLTYTTTPWYAGGSLYSGIDVNAGKSHTGLNDAWLSSNGTGYWGSVEQTVQVLPHRLYRFSVWVRNSQNFDNAWIGVKNPDGDVLSQVRNGPGANYTHYNVTFNSAENRSVVVFAGYWGPGPAAWEQIDDAALLGPRP